MNKTSKQVKLVKISELSHAIVPHNIDVGYEVYGFEESKPEIGKPYRVVRQEPGYIFQTSTVMNIDKNIIITRNSKYRIEYISRLNRLLKLFKRGK
jgi:hypothetical protein